MQVTVEPSTDDAIYIFQASTIYQAALFGLKRYIDDLEYFDSFPTYFTVTNLKTKKQEKVSSQLIVALMSLSNEGVVVTNEDIHQELQIEQEWFNEKELF